MKLNQKKIKKILLSILALVIVTVAIAELRLSSAPSKPYKIFIGEWKRVDTAQKDNAVIKSENGGIVIHVGKDITAAVYNSEKKALIIYFMADTTVVSYREKTDHLVINGGKDGEFERIK